MRFFILTLLLIWTPTLFGLCVESQTANLRSGPSTNYPKSWEVYKYMPFKLIKRKGDWYHVQDLEGDKHWVYKKLVTSKFKCAAVKVSKANLRTGPGTRYPQSVVYPSADKYESFKVLKTKDGWALLQDMDGDKLWVSKKLLWIQ